MGDADVKDVFELFDRDADGKISVTDVPLVIRSIGGNPTNAELKEWMNELDIKGNNVDLSTFKKLVDKAIANWRGEDVITSAFKQFDKQSTGSVSVEEMRTILTTMGETLSTEEVEAMIEEADPSKSGRINYNDYAKLLSDKPLSNK
eukprot:TRINITY_DN408_c0_g1_i1.p1 TRINITY_DN408_c0_g1~~TRINITY_DN408_c0_g1_i1.p1  ORF type:complete len:147 (+),score=53.71 TRINITY_DN408_c0_g1_i1:42-482(+)